MKNRKSAGRNENDVLYVKLCEYTCGQIDLCKRPVSITLEPIMQGKRIQFRLIAKDIGHVGYLPHGLPLKYIDRIYNEHPMMEIDDIMRDQDGTIIYIYIKIAFSKAFYNNVNHSL